VTVTLDCKCGEDVDRCRGNEEIVYKLRVTVKVEKLPEN